MALRRDFTLAAADGIALSVADHLQDPTTGTRRGVVLMHGLGEHSGRYAHVVQFFKECGWSVRTYDHRGHGRSGGALGDVPDNAAILRDAKLVIDDFAGQLGTAPLLFGHSMGGLFAARFATAAMSPLCGLILSSPALALPLSGLQKMLLKVLGTVAPGLAVPNGLETRYLSHDQAVIDAYNNDPLVHPKISARLLMAMLDAIAFSQAHAANLAIPTLMVVAGDDHAVDAKGSKAFFASLKAGTGTFHLYDALYHEIFNELERQRVFDDVRAWLTRLPP